MPAANPSDTLGCNLTSLPDVFYRCLSIDHNRLIAILDELPVKIGVRVVRYNPTFAGLPCILERFSIPLRRAATKIDL
jgi:hypothetical protein